MMALFPTAVLIAVSLLSSFATTSGINWYSKKTSGSRAAYYLFLAFTSYVAAAVVLLLNITEIRITAGSALLSLLFAAAVSSNIVFTAKALACGPLSYTMVIVNMSTIISSLSGTLFWGEEFSLLKVIGMLFMAGCMTLAVKKDRNGKSMSVKWFFLTLGAFATCAGIGLTQKLQQMGESRSETPGFIFLMFVFSALFATAMSVFLLRKPAPGDREMIKETLLRKKTFLISIAYGAAGASIHLANITLCGRLPTAVMFPVVNGGALIITMLSSAFLFKEKLQLQQKIGLFLGIIAFVLLGI